MKETKINYQKFVEEWAKMCYGCLCCKNSGRCKDNCIFELDFYKLIDCFNDSPHVDENQQLDIKNYIEHFYIDNE